MLLRLCIWEQWSLDPKNQTCITTDNGSNNLCTARSHLVWPYLSCFGHNLHLAREIGTTTLHIDGRKKRDLSLAQTTLARGEAIMLVKLSIILFSNSHNFAYYVNSCLILQHLAWPIYFVLYVLLESIDLMLLKLASHIGKHGRL